jgi:thiol-disulfide isomerase/thioredoxin
MIFSAFIIVKHRWQQKTLPITAKLPELTIKIDTSFVKLSSFNKGLTFIKFISPSCSLCVKETDEIIKLAKNNRDKSFIILEPLFSSDIVKIKRVDMPNNIVLGYAGREVADAFEFKGFPILYLYKDGRFLLRIKGNFTIKPILIRLNSNDSHNNMTTRSN